MYSVYTPLRGSHHSSPRVFLGVTQGVPVAPVDAGASPCRRHRTSCQIAAWPYAQLFREPVVTFTREQVRASYMKGTKAGAVTACRAESYKSYKMTSMSPRGRSRRHASAHFIHAGTGYCLRCTHKFMCVIQTTPRTSARGSWGLLDCSGHATNSPNPLHHAVVGPL